MSERICSVDDCESIHLARGFCAKHYRARRRSGMQILDKPQHRLSEIDEESMRGTCQVCGPGVELHRASGRLCCRANLLRMRRERRAKEIGTEKYNAYYRDYIRRRKYRLDRNGVEALFDASGGECPICLTTLTLQTMRIDHDHSCCDPEPGKPICGECIRGVLCNSCNTGLGLLGDRPDRLLRAVTYLSRTAA